MPVCKTLPPVEAAYQRHDVPLLPGEAERVIEPEPQRLMEVVVGNDGIGFKVISIMFDVASQLVPINEVHFTNRLEDVIASVYVFVVVVDNIV